MKRVELRSWERYFDARDLGLSVVESARKARLAVATAYRFERGDQTCSGLEAAKVLNRVQVAGNRISAPLSTDAAKALEDFAYFRLRYFGRRSTPWQERAAYEILRSLDSPSREFVVINCPPGSGKSTLFTHDIICWLVARNRAIRIMIGARTERQARAYVGRVKKTLERHIPMKATADDLVAGLMIDAVACIPDDYGEFKPEARSDKWRAEALVVRQVDGTAVDDKEDTVSAWGQDSGFLGGRYDLVVWDDLVDRKNTRTSEAKADIRAWWSEQAETRLEPRGVLVLQGQRIAHDDLYRYCLDQRTVGGQPRYRHIVYPAHDDEGCFGHDNDVVERPPAWPAGCLLDPWRIPWVGDEGLETIKHNNPRVFDVQYQQRDGDLVGGLIDPAWITGGVDSDGYPAPGCLDRERGVGIVPDHLTNGRGWSFLTVDPAPTEWWGVIWWIYDPMTENRYAIDLIRRKMNPEDFLSIDLNTLAFSGLVEDLRKTATMAGAPLQLVVFEVNAAQKWLLQSPHVQRYMDTTGLIFVPHTTGINKADPKFGLESIGDLFRQGKIRLPYANPNSRIKSATLVDEGLKYPDADTTDMLMSAWFGKLAVENHYAPIRQAAYRMDRPTWLRGSTRGMPGVLRGIRYG